MQVPSFLKLEGNSLLFNEDNKTFVFIVPNDFFASKSKMPIATIYGEYVTMIGLCNWTIIDSNGKMGEIKPFNFPTMIMCRPATIEKVKDYKLSPDREPEDYVLLKFNKGDEVISQTRVPQLIDNVELLFKLLVVTAKIPNSIPYDKIWEIFLDSMSLNGNSYGLNAQLFGIISSVICRDKNDISREFRYTDMKNMCDYKPISIKLVPNYISPYTAITSENFDESLRSAIMMQDKKDIPYSPLERIVTM